MEQGSKTIAFEADSQEEIIKMVGPRAESQGKSFVIFGQVGIVQPVKTYTFKSQEDIQAEVAAAAAAAAVADAAAKEVAKEQSSETLSSATE